MVTALALSDIPIPQLPQQYKNSPAEASLILNRRRGLLRDVVEDAVDALDFVDDSAGYLLQEFRGESRPVRGHGVFRRHGAQGDDLLVGALVAHDADALHRQQRREGLPDLAVLPALPQLLDEDAIGFPPHAH